MKKFAISTAIAALVLASSVPAVADCSLSQKTFEREIVSGKLRQEHFRTVVADLRKLRQAALTLGRYGKEEACEEVVEAMRSLALEPPRNVALRPVTELAGKLRILDILDSEIRDSKNEYVGHVEDIVIDASGAIGYIVVEYGGFLGLGEEQTAIPFKSLKVSANRDVLFIPLTYAQFEKAPRFKRNTFNWVEDTTWRDRVDDYYKKPSSN